MKDPFILHVSDTVASAVAFSIPWWWDLIDKAGHIVIFTCAVIIAILRVMLLWKEYKQYKTGKHK